MTDQLQLIDVPAERKPSTRTEFVLNAIRSAGDTGLYPDEVGAILHAHDGNHSAADRCEWCGRDGARILRRLHRQRLITQRHGNAAVIVDATPVADGKRTGMSERIPY